MNAAQAGGARPVWWRRWWAKLATLEAVMDYSPTDYLLDRMKLLEGGMREMRAELDALKAEGLEP